MDDTVQSLLVRGTGALFWGTLGLAARTQGCAALGQGRTMLGAQNVVVSSTVQGQLPVDDREW